MVQRNELIVIILIFIVIVIIFMNKNNIDKNIYDTFEGNEPVMPNFRIRDNTSVIRGDSSIRYDPSVTDSDLTYFENDSYFMLKYCTNLCLLGNFKLLSYIICLLINMFRKQNSPNIEGAKTFQLKRFYSSMISHF